MGEVRRDMELGHRRRRDAAGLEKMRVACGVYGCSPEVPPPPGCRLETPT
jgi:hypothetical protein